MTSIGPALTVKVIRLRHLDQPLPAYATAGAAGIDLRASAHGWLPVGGFRAWPTGIAIELPQGFEGQIRPRSGLAVKHGVTILNAPGTIDSDYRGEVMAILINHGLQPFEIRTGDRIAQLVISPVTRADIEVAWTISETDRGSGGLGSTGVA